MSLHRQNPEQIKANDHCSPATGYPKSMVNLPKTLTAYLGGDYISFNTKVGSSREMPRNGTHLLKHRFPGIGNREEGLM